jgi:hypothetical protein
MRIAQEAQVMPSSANVACSTGVCVSIVSLADEAISITSF